MRKFIFFAVASLLFFGVGLGASWFLMQQRTDSEDTDTGKPLSSQLPADPAAVPQDTEGPDGALSQRLPVALRGEPLSAEEVFRFGEIFKDQQTVLKRRQDALARENVRLKLVHEDIQGTRRELDGMLAQIDDAMQAGEQILAKVQQESQQLGQQKDELEQQLNEMQKNGSNESTQEATNIKRMSKWIQAMPPEKAAELLREMCDEGKLAIAAKLLANLEEREGAKILAAFQDASLGLQITEEIIQQRPPQRTAKKRR